MRQQAVRRQRWSPTHSGHGPTMRCINGTQHPTTSVDDEIFHSDADDPLGTFGAFHDGRRAARSSFA